MKTILASIATIVALSISGAQATSIPSSLTLDTVPGKSQSSIKQQANCSFTYRRECNGYCWVCY